MDREEGERGRHDQNTLYYIFKELIKMRWEYWGMAQVGSTVWQCEDVSLMHIKSQVS